MNKPGKSTSPQESLRASLRISLLAALLTSAFGVAGVSEAQAAGLGKLTVYSAIGQPLNAEVALTATPEEMSALSAKLASHDDFKKAGIEFMSALSGLRLSVAKQPDGQPVLKLTTERPLNEPFLHFLVELNWTAGRLVREYTFLLDPPEMLQVARPASVVTPVVPHEVLPVIPQVVPVAPAKAQAEPLPTRSADAAPVIAAKPKPRATPVTEPSVLMPSSGERQVKSGETLSKIALENKPATVGLDQMLVALFNSNREAFDGNNMNRLRAGKILRLPDPGVAAGIDAREARKLIVAQTADFNAYRRSLAAAAALAPATETQPQQRAAGKIKPQVESKAPPVAIRDKLEVSPTEAAQSAGAAKSAGSDKVSGATSKAALEEDLIARDKALREASGRIAELEKNLENLKHLVELKSQAGAQVQQQAQAALPKLAEVKKPEPAPTVKPVVEPVSAPSPAVAEKPVEAAPPVVPVAEKPTEAPAAAKPAEPPPATVAPTQPAAKKPAAPPPPEPGFVEENPELVFGGGGLLALLLGYLGFSAYRRKKQAREEIAQHDEPGVAAGGLAVGSGAMVGAASESVDSGEVSIQGDFSEGGVLTTAESVDPVAEAEVYMAYGRDSQAEEILLEGLKTDPTRTAIHLKLLELYANRKSVPRFEFVANELHGLSGGKGHDWDRAVALAAGLGLTGGLFAVAAAAVSPVVSMTDQGGQAAIEAALVAEAQPPVEEEVGSFDFDLDLGTASGVSGVGGLAVAAEPVAQQPAAEAGGLDFDFDLGSPTQNPPPVEMAETAAVDSNAIDFSLDIGSSTEPLAAEPSAVLAPAATTSNEIDFDLDSSSAQATPVAIEFAEPVAKSSVGELDFNFDLELGAAEPTPTGADTEPGTAVTSTEPFVALDLAGINFDLGEPGATAEQSAPLEEAIKGADVAAPAVAPDANPDAVAVETDDSEVATKLELALAYEEMGDREGARELLNEVLNEGSPAQQGQARARLDQLDL
ncbi:MAG: FimV/HubP family polar landmark protein [Rhodocyclaceae bacterium]|nr:FimV/HubP family polar landmark protein [Rhodocyclaceae bacterium]